MEIPVVVQHRHAHLSTAAVKTLFGQERLTPDVELEQGGQFVAKEKVQVMGPKGSFDVVSVIGPERVNTQVELSSSDAFAIGVKAPLRISGDLDRSATVILKGSAGEKRVTMSTIVPIRHVHLPTEMAKRLKLNQHDVVELTLKERPHITLGQVIVRIHPTFLPALHLTKDEAATDWIQTGDIAIL